MLIMKAAAACDVCLTAGVVCRRYSRCVCCSASTVFNAVFNEKLSVAGSCARVCPVLGWVGGVPTVRASLCNNALAGQVSRLMAAFPQRSWDWEAAEAALGWMNVHPLKWQCAAADGAHGTLPYPQLLCNAPSSPLCAAGCIALLYVTLLFLHLVCGQTELMYHRIFVGVCELALKHAVHAYLSGFKCSTPVKKRRQ